MEFSLEEMDRDFQTWFKKELFPENSNEKPSRGSVKVKFLLAKEFIIHEAQKGFPRIYVWKYLKVRGKIDGVYDTFLRHLKKYDIDKYFSEDFKNQAERPAKPPSSSGIEALSEAPGKDEKPETAPVPSPKKSFNHSPHPDPQKHLGETPEASPPPTKRQWISSKTMKAQSTERP